MKLKKLLIASAVVAAVAGAMSTAAFAEGDFVATYENGTVTLGAYTEIATDNTMVIVDTGADGEKLTEINEENIHQINQQAGAYTAIPVGELAPGKYEVRIGGDGNLYSAIFEVKGEAGDSPYYDDGTVLLGNASLDSEGTIDSEDVLIVLDYTVGERDYTKDQLQAMDVNESTNIDSEDVLIVLDYTVGVRTILGEKTIGERTEFVSVDGVAE